MREARWPNPPNASRRSLGKGARPSAPVMATGDSGVGERERRELPRFLLAPSCFASAQCRSRESAATRRAVTADLGRA